MAEAESALGVRLEALAERFTSSLFGRPAVWVITAVVLSRVTLFADRRLDQDDAPVLLDTTVESGRALLGAVAAGTITAASVVFSLTLVSVQLASSQYSPRTLRNFLGDRYQQHVIGIVLGTFAFSVLVLREIRGPLSDGGSPVVARIGVFVATVLAVISLFALLASINRTAQGLRVSSVVRRVSDETLRTIETRFPVHAATPPAVAPGESSTREIALDVVTDVGDPPPGTTALVTAPRTGWVQQIAVEALAGAAPRGATVRLEVAVGSYVTEGEPLVAVWPMPDPDDETLGEFTGAFAIGDERTQQQDIAYGLLKLEDVALRALSPGVNDPNTAIAVIAALGSILLTLLERDLGSAVTEHDGRVVARSNEPTRADFVEGALAKIRRAGRDDPAVLEALIVTLHGLRSELIRRRCPHADATAAVEAEAARVLAEVARAGMIAADRRRLVELSQRLEMTGGG